MLDTLLYSTVPACGGLSVPPGKIVDRGYAGSRYRRELEFVDTYYRFPFYLGFILVLFFVRGNVFEMINVEAHADAYYRARDKHK